MLPKISKFLLNWQNFAKSGHTESITPKSITRAKNWVKNKTERSAQFYPVLKCSQKTLYLNQKRRKPQKSARLKLRRRR